MSGKCLGSWAAAEVWPAAQLALTAVEPNSDLRFAAAELWEGGQSALEAEDLPISPRISTISRALEAEDLPISQSRAQGGSGGAALKGSGREAEEEEAGSSASVVGDVGRCGEI